MALQVSKTNENGAVASYWRVYDWLGTFVPEPGNGAQLQFEVRGYHNKDYRDKDIAGGASVLYSQKFNLTKAADISGTLASVDASGDLRGGIYSWLKTQNASSGSVNYDQHGAEAIDWSSATDV